MQDFENLRLRKQTSIYVDRRANINTSDIQERVRREIQKVYASRNEVERIFFPERTNQIPDWPAVTLVVLAPEMSLEEALPTKAFVESLVRECGASARTFKSALIFCVAQAIAPLQGEAHRLLAWEEIQDELASISIDDAQRTQLVENIKKAQRDLKESVWRTYKNVLLLDKAKPVPND